MNLTRAESVDLVKAVVAGLGDTNVDVAVCPPSAYLDAARQAPMKNVIGFSAG